MYTINELEFIGESLPKINDNFTELQGNISVVNAKVTNLMSLSSAFYTNNASNFISDVDSTQITVGTTQFTKSSFTSLNGNIIYPITVYLSINYTSLPSGSIKFSCTPSAGDSEIELSSSDYLVANKNQLFTFIDLGFYKWTITIPENVNSGNLYLVYKYST